MSIRQLSNGRWEQRVRLFTGGRVYVSVTDDRPDEFGSVVPPEAVANMAEAAASAAAGCRAMAAAAAGVSASMRAWRERAG